MQTIAERLGYSPNISECPRERERLIDERHGRGEPDRPFPAMPSILIRYSSWEPR